MGVDLGFINLSELAPSFHGIPGYEREDGAGLQLQMGDGLSLGTLKDGCQYYPLLFLEPSCGTGTPSLKTWQRAIIRSHTYELAAVSAAFHKREIFIAYPRFEKRPYSVWPVNEQ